MFDSANEYLLDFAKNRRCNEWISKVISTFFQKEAETHIQDLAEDLLQISKYVIVDEENRTTDNTSNKVYLKELIHNSGVNALADHQIIKFTPQVNIIYGLNGTGKSSYFRILNEMIGGANPTAIRPNIYRDDVEPISVSAKYVLGTTEKQVMWDGTYRGIEDLKTLRVFDSFYTRDFLKKRNSDELVVKPYGLNVFADLIQYIDEISEKANELIQYRISQCPEIRFDNIADVIVDIIQKTEYSEDDIITIRSILDADVITDDKIQEQEKLVNDLKIGNPKDKIVNLRAQMAHIERIKTFIENAVTCANEFIESVNQQIRLYVSRKEKSEDYKKKLEILQSIPGTDSQLWREFISKGIEYKNLNAIEVCPFCHQSLSAHANEILSSYALFLDNKAQIEFNEIENNLVNLLRKIEKWNLICNIEDEKWTDNLRVDVNAALKELTSVQQCLKNRIVAKSVNETAKIDFKELIAKIAQYLAILQSQVDALSNEVNGKTTALSNAEKVLTEMKSIYAVQSQRLKIEKSFEIKNWASEKRKIITELATQKQKISSLSRKAHNELLTEQLQVVFAENLKKLNVQNIEIELQGKNNKGIQQTELTIKSNKEVTTILSEGEQKATALALFLAEIFLSHNKSTIVFDDPVNSLDHRMMQALADMLMNIENQIIVFTHNKMFLDCFECTKYGHICKDINSACGKNKGKHIYLYETSSEGQNRKGVIVEKQAQNLEFYLKALKNMLNESPFTKYDDAAIKLRRGVETAIDEIVFNRQVPTKLSNKNSRINWDELKKLSNDAELIDGLKQIHDRVSGGDLHNGSERENNPIDREEIEQLYEKLKQLCNYA